MSSINDRWNEDDHPRAVGRFVDKAHSDVDPDVTAELVNEGTLTDLMSGRPGAVWVQQSLSERRADQVKTRYRQALEARYQAEKAVRLAALDMVDAATADALPQASELRLTAVQGPADDSRLFLDSARDATGQELEITPEYRTAVNDALTDFTDTEDYATGSYGLVYDAETFEEDGVQRFTFEVNAPVRELRAFAEASIPEATGIGFRQLNDGTYEAMTVWTDSREARPTDELRARVAALSPGDIQLHHPQFGGEPFPYLPLNERRP